MGRRIKLDYFYVIGSAAVFASVPNAVDTAVAATRDVDIIPSPTDSSKIAALADQIDFILGEGPDFDNENGFYVQGLDNTTPTFAPKNWLERAIPIRTGGYTSLCMEVHDLALSKYGAGREKDLAFTRALACGGHIQKPVLLERLREVPTGQAKLELMRSRIQSDFGDITT